MLTKRIISAALALSVALGSSALTASAQMTVNEQGLQHHFGALAPGKVKLGSKFSYRVNPDGKSVSLIQFSDKALSANTLKIPTKLDSMPVTCMAEDLSGSFDHYYKQIKVVDIPKSVTSIERGCMPMYVRDKANRFIYFADIVTIACNKKTAAETFAAENNYKYNVKDATKTYVHAVRLAKGVSVSKSRIKFKWYKVKNVDGYRVYRMVNGKWKKLIDLDAGTNFYKDTACDTQNDNFYMVRAFVKSGSKTYWSKKSTIKIVNCMDTKAPDVKEISCDKNEYSVTVTINGDGERGKNYYIQVQDPESGSWSEPIKLNNSAGEISENFREFSFIYNDKEYTDEFIGGKKYKIRVRRGMSVYDSATLDSNSIYCGMEHLHYGKAYVKTVEF